MSTALVILLSCAAAGLLAWTVRRYETSRDARPSACARVLGDVFADGASTADSVLLARLLEHRDACLGDAAYVDQVRRLLVNAQQVDGARALLEAADRRHAFAPDELAAQVAWVDLGAAHLAWTSDSEPQGAALHARAVAAAEALRRRWPEWSTPYLILDEARGASWAASPAMRATDYYQIERRVRGRVLNGAFVRALTEWQTVAFTFVAAALGMLGLCAGASGLIAMREMARLHTASIATARPGYVELAGTLHVPPNATAVIGPHSHTPGVWYERATNSGGKGARTSYDRSAQPFVLRDATGEVLVDPAGMTVRTRHSTTTLRSGGVTSGGRVSERMLHEGDVAYALGELTVTSAPDGAPVRRLRVAENGRRLLVSNHGEATLRRIERRWLWVGATAFVLAAIVLAWSYHQRYQVLTVPGVLP